MVPNASMRGSSLRARPPPRSPVVPSSPEAVSSSIRFLRGTLLSEDPAELVEILWHAPGLGDHVDQRHDLHAAVAPDRDDPALPRHDQVGRAGAEPRGPDAIGRRRRPAALEVAEHGHPRLEAGLPLEAAGEEVAHAPLGAAHMAEGGGFALTRVGLDAGDADPLGHDDDAEQPAVAAALVEVR